MAVVVASTEVSVVELYEANVVLPDEPQLVVELYDEVPDQVADVVDSGVSLVVE